MNKLFQYVAFSLEVSETIRGIFTILESGNISAPALLAAVTTAVTSLQTTFGIEIPTKLVSDIVTAAADAINDYFSKPKA